MGSYWKSRMKRAVLFFLPLVSISWAASGALAAPILWVDDSLGNIGTVDIATGGVTVVGPAGVALTDIAFNPSGNLYGVDFTRLYSINKTSGTATAIGTHGISGANALVFGSDGTLYGAGNLNTKLYTIDVVTGAGTALGGTLPTGSAGDLAFNGGNLFLSGDNGQLVKVNASAGTGENVGSFGVASVFGLATAEDGTLYAVAGTNVYSVNTTTGAATLVVGYGGQGLSDGFGSDAVVPEPGTITLLGISLAGLGLARWRRRRQN